MRCPAASNSKVGTEELPISRLTMARGGMWGTGIPVLKGVLSTISRYNMLAPGSRVIAAVSGGADSVCLAHVLAGIAPGMGVKLAGIAHYNHRLRGADSE